MGGGSGSAAGGPAKREKAPAERKHRYVATVTKTLVLSRVDARFAPGVESLNIRYDIRALAGETVKLRVSSATYPNNPLFERDLTDPEKADGTNKTLTWDGATNCAAGPLASKLINPAYSPYDVTLEATGVPSSTKSFRVEVNDITLTTGDTAAKWLMNDPTLTYEISAAVRIKKIDGTGVAAGCPVDVGFTFSDPAPANTTRAASYAYPPAPPTPLGKASDPAAVFWQAVAGFTASSADGFKTSAKVEAVTAAGPTLGVAKIKFAPAGVGGDTYKIKATVLAADGTTALANRESPELTVIRSVTFAPYEMTGQTHISSNGTDAKIAAYYTPAVFVNYHLGAVTTLLAANSVRYLALWDHATSMQKNWATSQAKTAAETPSAAEKTDANGPAGAAQTAARAAIQVKANAWRDRLLAEFQAGFDNWATDAGIPVNSMVSVEHLHPKFSAHAPAADSETSEWTDFTWLRITVMGLSIHPDKRWKEGEGVSYQSRAYVFAGMSSARTEVAVAHEAGHETKNQFKRDTFGPGDHSSAAGLMDPFGSISSFTAREIKILRGIVP
jgi:hypothetical protein